MDVENDKSLWRQNAKLTFFLSFLRSLTEATLLTGPENEGVKQALFSGSTNDGGDVCLLGFVVRTKT